MAITQFAPGRGDSAITPGAGPVQLPPPGIADPAPLGLAGFAMTTFVLSVFNAHIISNQKLSLVVLPIALFYGGIAQLLAGMWEFKNRNTFGALAFTSYGAFWLGLAAYLRYIAPGLPAGQAYKATGLYLLVWTIFTSYMLLASLKTNGVVFSVFAVLFVTLIFLTVGELAKSTGWTKVGGWLGLVTAVLAWYGSAAGVTNATWGRTVLPTWPAKK